MPKPRSEDDEAYRAAARRHAIKRAWERLELRLGLRDLNAIERYIRAGGGQLIREQRDGRKIVKVSFRNAEFCVAYEPRLFCLCTVMPPDFRACRVSGVRGRISRRADIEYRIEDKI